jgi:anti-anti-sigma factor
MTTPSIFQPRTRVLSAAAAPELLYWIASLLESGERYLLVDLRDVLFMDKSGLGALTIAHGRVQKAGGTLALCHLNGQARMLFEMSGLDRTIEVYSNAREFERVLQTEPGPVEAIAEVQGRFSQA